MPKAVEPKFYLKLSVEERLELAGEILESVGSENAPIPLSDAAYAEAKRRLDEMEADPSRCLTWEELCAQLGWKP